ncbi:MAG: hypothetical protein IT427_04020 [Pirellulales bacterium]|nr:hypothetical protein [Pirellulales bacterium]
MAGVLGMLAWVVVIIFANGVITFSYWAASWSGGVGRISNIQKAVQAVSEEIALPDKTAVFVAGINVIYFWVTVVKYLAVGFLFSYFWCATTYIYFMLRQAVDATEMDEVAVEEEPDAYGLPPLQGEPGSVPQVNDSLADNAAPSTTAVEPNNG